RAARPGGAAPTAPTGAVVVVRVVGRALRGDDGGEQARPHGLLALPVVRGRVCLLPGGLVVAGGGHGRVLRSEGVGGPGRAGPLRPVPILPTAGPLPHLRGLTGGGSPVALPLLVRVVLERDVPVAVPVVGIGLRVAGAHDLHDVPGTEHVVDELRAL